MSDTIPEDAEQVIYTVALDETAHVPMSAQQIRNSCASKRLTLNTPLWRPGLDDWTTIGACTQELGIQAPKPKPELKPLPPRRKPVRVNVARNVQPFAVGPVVQTRPTAYGSPMWTDPRTGQSFVMVKSQKSRGAYVALSLFLGPLGIHDFYAGHIVSGIFLLIATSLIGWTGIGLLVIWLVNIIQCFGVTKDGSGMPFS